MVALQTSERKRYSFLPALVVKGDDLLIILYGRSVHRIVAIPARSAE
jgi:hypothetical protein